jgi:hypothetical protein
VKGRKSIYRGHVNGAQTVPGHSRVIEKGRINGGSDPFEVGFLLQRLSV